MTDVSDFLKGMQLSLTRPESPKVVRERKESDRKGSPRGSKLSEKLVRRIHDLHSSSWALKYEIEDNDYAKGAYGKVILARDRINRERVVIKKIPTTTPARMIVNEVKAGKTIAPHSNIATMHQYVEKSDFHYIVFQFIQGIDMFVYLEKLNFSPRSDKEARSIIIQVLDSLRHIHNHSIAHRDIKLENLLIDPSGKVFVIDFGLCTFMDRTKPCRDFCGSDNYLAPEIVRRLPYDGYKADVFSTGVVLFSLLFGVFPFENLRVNGHHSSDASSRPLKRLQVRFPSDVSVSKSAKDLLTRMLEDDPFKRISIDEIFCHDWLTAGLDQSPVLNSLKLSCESSL